MRPSERAGAPDGADGDPAGEWVWLSESGSVMGVSIDAVRGRIGATRASAARARPADRAAVRVPLGGALGPSPTLGSTRAARPTSPRLPSQGESADGATDAAMVELVRLVGRLQEQNRGLACQVGCLQAQLQHARETIHALEAPRSAPASEAPPAPSWWRRLWHGLR
jgi:hypothetical protein